MGANIGIYKITSPTNKVYIGQSWNLEERLGDYRRMECKKQRKLFNSIKKYGWASHKFEVVMFVSENVTQLMFDEIEQHYMDYYRKNGYELMNLRGAGSRGRHSEETKKKMSISLTGKVNSPEAIERMRISKTNPSAEIRANLSTVQKKLWSDPNHRLKMSLAHKGHVVSEETKIKLRLIRPKGSDHPRSRAILQFTKNGEFVREWAYLTEAAKHYDVSHSSISNCIRGKVKTSCGFIWKYKKEN